MNQSFLGKRTFNSVNAHPLIKSQSVRMLNTFSPLTKPPPNNEYIYNNYHNRPPNVSSPYKPLIHKPGEYIVSPIEKEHNSIQKRLIDRELMLKESESVIDDIELYGLIATNELLAVDRAQQRLAKVDPCQDIEYFANRIDLQSRKACDGIIKDCQVLGDEINTMQDNICNYLDRNDITIKNADKDKELQDNFNKVKISINNGIYNSTKKVDDNAERIRQMTEYIKNVDVEIIKNDVLQCQVDWKKRKEMQKECYAMKRIMNEYYDPAIEEINKKEKEITNQVVKINDTRKIAKKRQFQLNRSRERRKYELMRLIDYVKLKVNHLGKMEQLVNERKLMMKRQYESMIYNMEMNKDNNRKINVNNNEQEIKKKNSQMASENGVEKEKIKFERNESNGENNDEYESESESD